MTERSNSSPPRICPVASMPGDARREIIKLSDESNSKQLLYIKGQLKPFGNRCRCEWARCPNRLIQTLHFIAYIREDFQKVSTEGLFKYRCRRPWRRRIWKFVPDIVHVICTKSAARSASNLQIGIGSFCPPFAHIILPAGSRRL